MMRWLRNMMKKPKTEPEPAEKPEPKKDEFGRRIDWQGLPINPAMGEGRWQDALRRMRATIARGSKLSAEDSTTIGDKYTTCSWGMCSDSDAQWPDPDDHIWPHLFERDDRVAPRAAPGGCPMDKRTGTDEESRWGCFYHCRVFGKEIKKDDRKRALELYDETIATREAAHGRLVTEDDNEPWRNPS